jgi:sulfhydrogenase subunit alpha
VLVWRPLPAARVFDLHRRPGAIEMAKDHRDLVERGLRLKKAGNAIIALVGGRAVHPVNVKVGGFYRLPDRRELLALRPQL